ncbi:MAG: helix-turn-helix domain-containing protein [Syntrophomonadaceae bacterium]
MVDKGRFPPWSRIPSLEEMSREAGIDFDELITAFKQDLSVTSMAQRFEVSEETVTSLLEHFQHYGVASVMGGD